KRKPSFRRAHRGSRPESRRSARQSPCMLRVAGHAERLEVVEMMGAAQGGVTAFAGFTVVDLQAVLDPGRAPGAQSGPAAGRALRRGMAAAHAAPAVALLGGPPRHRPPMVAPEIVRAGLSAPAPAPGGKNG